MHSHGRFESCVSFAEKKENYELIILHHINEEEYKEAIYNLKYLREDKVIELIYRYAHILMSNEPGYHEFIQKFL